MKRFVTFEGIDGSGKSTISKLVYKQLKKEHDLILTREPTNTWIGKQVQECIKTNTDPFITAFTFVADRIDHCRRIQQWLDDGAIVLCDRYAESTYAYQGAQLEQKIPNPIQWLQDLSRDRIMMPDRTFLFIIDPNTSLSRIQHRETLIPFERVSFLTKVHANYLKLATEPRFVKLDATQSKQTLVDLCCRDILS